MNLNQSAFRSCEPFLEHPSRFHVAVLREESGAQIIDCGVHVAGGVEAGRRLAQVCLAGLGDVSIVPGDPTIWAGPAVVVRTDHPIPACMASQYAGWQIAGEKFFGMGSGPMRAVRGKEKLFDDIGWRERGEQIVGVLESGKLPARDVCQHIADECQIDPEYLTLLVAPTSSIAGTIQVVARTVETALHKLHELRFDLKTLVSGFGVAPLPPIAENDLAGIGRTNDAILYGGHVTLWVECDDRFITEIGPRVPSSASSDHGRPFSEIFKRYNRDFYKIDPLLFSPAVVCFHNLKSGRMFSFGELQPKIVQQSFQG